MSAPKLKLTQFEFFEDEMGLLLGGIVFLVLHHEQGMREANERAQRFPKVRKACERVAEHHQEQIYQAGELAAKLGFRNGWPRPASDRSSRTGGQRT